MARGAVQSKAPTPIPVHRAAWVPQADVRVLYQQQGRRKAWRRIRLQPQLRPQAPLPKRMQLHRQRSYEALLPPPRFPMARAAAGPASNTNTGAGTGASPNDPSTHDGGRPQFQARVTPSQEGLAACRALRDYNSQVATWIQDTFNMSLIQIRDTIIEGNGCFSVKTMSDYNQFQSWASKTGLVPREPGEDVNEHNRTIACYWDSLRDDEMVEVMEKVKAWNCENAKGMSKDKTKAAVSRLQKRVLPVTTEAEDLWGISMVSFI
ncbi:unnamed protein product, partial [Tilletia caries]